MTSPIQLMQILGVWDIFKYILIISILVSVIRQFMQLLQRGSFQDDFESVLPDPQRPVKEVTYKVRQRRLLRNCQYCGNPLSKKFVNGLQKCRSCGGQNQQYEYRIVDRVKYEYE